LIDSVKFSSVWFGSFQIPFRSDKFRLVMIRSAHIRGIIKLIVQAMLLFKS